MRRNYARVFDEHNFEHFCCCILIMFTLICLGRLILQSNLIDTIPKLTKSWRLDFEIKPIATSPQRTSVIHLTRGPNAERVPAVFFEPGTFKLSVCSNINGNKNHCFNSISLPKNVFTKVIVAQVYTGPKSHRYYIYYGGRVVYTTINRKAKPFANVKVYNGDKFYPSAKALVKGYTFQNYEGNFLNTRKLILYYRDISLVNIFKF